MRKITATIVLTIISMSLFSQDLIITDEGDSLNCRITKIKTAHIYFTFVHKGEVRNTLLPLSKVKAYQKGYFSSSEVPDDKLLKYKDYPHLRFALNGGWGYHTGRLANNMPPDFKDYMNKLRSGYFIDADLCYYFSESVGIGIKYDKYNAQNELDNVYVTYFNGTVKRGKMKDDITISHIGPVCSVRLISGNKRNAFLSNFSLGYMKYLDRATLIDNFTITGNTVGLIWELGYDIGLNEGLALGFLLSYNSGILTEYEIDNGIEKTKVELEKDNFESLFRINLAIGLRFLN
jgi:hypothetical protein